MLLVDYRLTEFVVWDTQTSGKHFYKTSEKILSADWSFDSKYIVVRMEMGSITLYSYFATAKIHSVIKISHEKAIYLHQNDNHLFVFSCGGTIQSGGVKILEIALHKINIKVLIYFKYLHLTSKLINLYRSRIKQVKP